MAGESISSLILFIAAMLIAAAVAGTLVTNVHEISGSIDTYGDDVQQNVETDLSIISDAGSDAVYNDSEETITLLVKNTGDRTLSTDEEVLDVLVDGEYVTSDDLTVTALDGDAWRPDDVVELEIDATAVETGGLPTDEHRITVGVGGEEEVFEFYGP